MNTLTDVGVKGLAYATVAVAVLVAQKRAELRGAGMYVLRTESGFQVAPFCDHCPLDVVAVVGASGVLWLAD